MRFKYFLLGGFSVVAMGCSHLKKQEAAPATPAAPTAEQAAADAKAKAAQEAAKKNEITCKLDNEVRTLEIETLTPKGCKLWYTRSGDRNTVASSTLGNTHCEQVRERIRNNLETAAYKCTTPEVAASTAAKTK